MKVLVFEQWNGGHYANYLNCLLPEVARLGCEVVVAVNSHMQSALTAAGRPPLPRNVSLTESLPAVSPALKPADRWAATRNLLASLHSVRPDFTLLPSADAQTTGMATLQAFGARPARQFGPIEATLHYGYGFAAKNGRDRLKEMVYSQIYRRAPYASVNFVNFAYYEFARAKRLVDESRIRLVGDPVPQPPHRGREAARRALGLDPDGRYAGLFGLLDRRKAVPELLAAFRAASRRPSGRLVLGGRLDPSYAALIAREYGDLVRADRIVVIDRFLSDAELECAYEALDVATVVYYQFPGLASLALKAVAAGTPILVHDFGWMSSLVRRFEVGTVTDISDVARFAECLRASLDGAERRAPSEAVRRLLEFHEERNFVARMLIGLCDASGVPRLPSRDWPWVLEALAPERRSVL